MEIQHVFTFWKSLLLFVWRRSANFWNFINFFKLKTKKKGFVGKAPTDAPKGMSNKVMTTRLVL
jgi:hypothetical protein